MDFLGSREDGVREEKWQPLARLLYRRPPTFEPRWLGLVALAVGKQPYPGGMPPAVELRAVISDWGGVLTPPIAQLVRAWATADQIDWDSYVTVIGPWLKAAYESDGARNPVHELERGECTVAEFEALLAERLVRIDGGPVLAEGMLARMLPAGEQPVMAMYDLIRGVRAQGVATALLSNSWGSSGYPREDFPSLFDAVVISCEVGMRKPEPEIFRHTAALLGLEPKECVFIDDIEANITAAEALGMTGIHHVDPQTTASRLADLFPVG
jgi:putative hydrolase of the HAD superfamily